MIAQRCLHLFKQVNGESFSHKAYLARFDSCANKVALIGAQSKLCANKLTRMAHKLHYWRIELNLCRNGAYLERPQHPPLALKVLTPLFKGFKELVRTF
jgi:hypothetical protein